MLDVSEKRNSQELNTPFSPRPKCLNAKQISYLFSISTRRPLLHSALKNNKLLGLESPLQRIKGEYNLYVYPLASLNLGYIIYICIAIFSLAVQFFSFCIEENQWNNHE